MEGGGSGGSQVAREIRGMIFFRAPRGCVIATNEGARAASPSFSSFSARARFVQTRIYETVRRIFVYITTAILARPKC